MRPNQYPSGPDSHDTGLPEPIVAEQINRYQARTELITALHSPHTACVEFTGRDDGQEPITGEPVYTIKDPNATISLRNLAPALQQTGTVVMMKTRQGRHYASNGRTLMLMPTSPDGAPVRGYDPNVRVQASTPEDEPRADNDIRVGGRIDSLEVDDEIESITVPQAMVDALQIKRPRTPVRQVAINNPVSRAADILYNVERVNVQRLADRQPILGVNGRSRLPMSADARLAMGRAFGNGARGFQAMVEQAQPRTADSGGRVSKASGAAVVGRVAAVTPPLSAHPVAERFAPTSVNPTAEQRPAAASASLRTANQSPNAVRRRVSGPGAPGAMEHRRQVGLQPEQIQTPEEARRRLLDALRSEGTISLQTNRQADRVAIDTLVVNKPGAAISVRMLESSLDGNDTAILVRTRDAGNVERMYATNGRTMVALEHWNPRTGDVPNLSEQGIPLTVEDPRTRIPTWTAADYPPVANDIIVGEQFAGADNGERVLEVSIPEAIGEGLGNQLAHVIGRDATGRVTLEGRTADNIRPVRLDIADTAGIGARHLYAAEERMARLGTTRAPVTANANMNAGPAAPPSYRSGSDRRRAARRAARQS